MDYVDEAAELNKSYNIPVDVGYVYVLHNGDGMYKIGKTRNLKDRIKTLQTASPTRLEVYRIFKSVHCGYAEESLHNFFAPYRESGEWFRLGPEQLNDLENWGDELYLKVCYI